MAAKKSSKAPMSNLDMYKGAKKVSPVTNKNARKQTNLVPPKTKKGM